MAREPKISRRSRVDRLRWDVGSKIERRQSVFGEPVKGSVFFSEALNFIWTPANLKIGKKGKLSVFNPVSMAFQEINFSIPNREKIALNGVTVDAFVAHFNLAGIETRAWINSEGVVVREESPTALIIQKEDALKIFNTMR